MEQSGWLFGAAGVVCFIGFVLVAIGTAQGISIAMIGGLGVAVLNGFIPWGLAIIGLGIMLGFFGAAVKGPSVEWSDIAPEPEARTDVDMRAPGTRYACPGCGGDVYASQTQCPECGHRLPTAPSARS